MLQQHIMNTYSLEHSDEEVIISDDSGEDFFEEVEEDDYEMEEGIYTCNI